jgi:hypothetical protein
MGSRQRALCVAAIVLACAATALAWNFGDTLPVHLTVRHGDLKAQRRAMAGQYSPRVGVHTQATIPAFHDEHRQDPGTTDGDKAPAKGADDFDADGSDGRPTEHHKYFSVAKGTAVQFHFASLKTQTGWISLDRQSDDGKSIERLAHLRMVFLYRHGIFTDIASITYQRRYAAHTKDLQIEYVWREEARSLPDRGIIVSYVASFIVLIGIGWRATSARRFKALSDVMVMRHRDE